MKTKLLTILLTLLPLVTWGADDDVFTAQTIEGVEMTFKVISEDEKTCQVGDGSNTAVNTVTEGTVTIPETAGDYRVISVGDRAFSMCFSISSIRIPDTVTTLGFFSFYACNITSLVIPSSITSIDNDSFLFCQNLESIIVEDGNTVYDSRDNCNAIIETATNKLIFGSLMTTIPNTVTTIGFGAFHNQSNLIEIVIPNSVTTIEYAAFWGCGITSLSIPQSVTKIDRNVFADCDKLLSIEVEEGNTVYDSRGNCNAIIETATNTLVSGCRNTVIPDGITTIGFWAFYGQEDLQPLTIPNSVTTISDGAFMFCDGLTSFFIPATVTTIGSDIFHSCSYMKEIVVEEGNPVYDSRENCNAIIETATNTLIQGCGGTVIPNSVTSIGSGAIVQNWLLTSITIPSSVTSIGANAFDYSSYLYTITSLIETPFEISNNTFDSDTYSNAVLYVPNHAVETYRSTPAWSNFKTIQGLSDPTPYAVLSGDTIKGMSLTFYYDSNRLERNGMSVAGVFSSKQPWYNNASYITSVVFDDSFANCTSLISTAYWFYDCINLKEVVGMDNLRTDNVSNMSNMFYGCSGLTTLDMSNFKTDNVTDMSYMFCRCYSLAIIYAGSSWTTSAVIKGYGMFTRCTNLVGGSGTAYDANHTDHTYAHIDGGTANPGYFTDKNAPIDDGSTDASVIWAFDTSANEQATMKPAIAFSGSSVVVDGAQEDGTSVPTAGDNTGYTFVRFRPAAESATFSVSWTVNVANGYTFIPQKLSMRMARFGTDSGEVDLSITNSEGESMTLASGLIPARNDQYRSQDRHGEDETYTSLFVADIPESFSTSGSITLTATASVYSNKQIGFSDIRLTGIVPTTIVDEVCVAPSFTLDGTTLTIQTETPDAQIYYTTDGTTPTTESNLYTQPIVLVQNDVIKAVATREGWIDSRVSVFTTNIFRVEKPLISVNNNMVYITTSTPDAVIYYTLDGTVPTAESERYSTPFVLPDNCIVKANASRTGYNTSYVATYNNLIPVPGRWDFTLGLSETTKRNLKDDTSGRWLYDSVSDRYTYQLYLEGEQLAATIDGQEWVVPESKGLLFYNGSSKNVIFVESASGGAYLCMMGNNGSIAIPEIAAGDSVTITYCTHNHEESRGFEINTEGFVLADGSTSVTSLEMETVTVYNRNNYQADLTIATHGIEIYCIDKIGQRQSDVDYTFDSYTGVLAVNGATTMADALEAAGGRAEVAKTITAVVWNSTATLTNADLQGLDNPNMLIYVNSEDQAPQNRNNVVVVDFAKTIVLTDVSEGNGNFYCPREFKAEMISYSHEYRQQTEVGVARGWESIALPFTVQTIMHETNGVIAPFNSDASNKHFWLRQMTEEGLTGATQIEANTPYLISMPNSDAYSAEFNQAGRVTFSSQNALVPMTEVRAFEMHQADGSMLVFMPSFQRQSADAMMYALNVGEQRDGYPEGSVFEANYRDIRPFEAFTIHEGGQRPAPQYLPIADMNGGVTGIENLTPSLSEGEGAWYDLSGRKLQQRPNRKGVYIMNGRKTVVAK